MKKNVLLFTVLAVLCFASSLNAGSRDTLRCERGLVLSGDLKIEVLGKCGEPLSKEVVGEVGSYKGPERRIVEEWVYNMGSSDFIYVLRFEGGRLESIQRGDRGH